MEDLYSQNISNFRFVAFDTETTGISTNNDHIVEIAALTFDEDFEHRKFSSLVKPPSPIPYHVSKIHGITNEMVQLSSNSKDVLKDFFEFLKLSGSPRILLAHNARFDVGMVQGEIRRFTGKNPLADFQSELVIDTCALAKNLLPDLPRHSLESLVGYFGIRSDGFHRAMQDVISLKQVFMELLSIACDRAADRNGLNLEQLLRLSGGNYTLFPTKQDVAAKEIVLSGELRKLRALVGTNAKASIIYETDDEGARYITPTEIRIKGLRVYVEAFCHRDQITKTFRGDKILKVGNVLDE